LLQNEIANTPPNLRRGVSHHDSRSALAHGEKQTILVSMERTKTVTWRDPSDGADAAKTLSGLEWLRAMARGDAPPPPFASVLGIRREDVEEGSVVVTLEPEELHCNPNGVLHGGIAATLFDSSLGCAVQSLLAPGYIAPTLQLQVNYIRPITTGTGKVFCSGKVVHMGKRSATAEGKLTDGEGKLYAHATGTFILTGPEDRTAR
jgi:uncharacterized protein (TIGR00369 family)